MNKDYVLFFIAILVFITIIGSVCRMIYTYSSVDRDCWIAQDPIICQKIKDGLKEFGIEEAAKKLKEEL